MHARQYLLVLIALLLLAGCSSDSSDASILPRPFTAEQIRDEWVPGLIIDMRRQTPEGVVVQRWTVVAADAEGVDIEYAKLDEAGEPSEERQVQRSGWVELRDHAAFPADRSTLEEVTRETALGTLEGWLYTVRDAESGGVTEFFFARSFPGAPVYMRAEQAGKLVMKLTQIARSRP
jgi:hypothetical protein